MRKIITNILVTLLIVSCASPYLVQAETTENISHSESSLDIGIKENFEESIEYVEVIGDNKASLINSINSDELSPSGGLVLVDQPIGEEVPLVDEEMQVLVVPLVIVLATVARYGITRAIAKHGLSQVTKATVSNAAKTKLTTDSAAKALASELGYKHTTFITKAGAKVFQKDAKDAVNGPKFISRDTTSHIGGVWKGANIKWENLNAVSTRSGTYDAVLDIMGD